VASHAAVADTVTHPAENLSAIYLAALKAVAGHGHLVRDHDEAGRKVAEICRAAEAKSVALANLPPALQDAIAGACEEAGLQCLCPPYDPATLPLALDGVEVGVTGAAFAIAQTGTMAEVTQDDSTRLVSGLPRTHIALAYEAQLIPTLLEAAGKMRACFADNPEHIAISFISGPSRTGDIEMILTLGVHGPEVFHGILVGEAR